MTEETRERVTNRRMDVPTDHNTGWYYLEHPAGDWKWTQSITDVPQGAVETVAASGTDEE